MKKFNISSLEKKFNNIDNIQNNIINDEKNFIKISSKKYNNKAIETIISVLLICFEEDYKIAYEYYYSCINDLSDAYLEGSDWYIGPNYTKEYYFNSLNEDIKYKYFFVIFFLLSIYQK